MYFLKITHFSTNLSAKVTACLIIILLNLNVSEGQSGLETTNSFSGHWSCINGNYMYGTRSETKHIYRKYLDGQGYVRRAGVTSLNPSFEIQNRIYSTTTDGLIFVLVKDSANVHYLLRSSDGGSSLTNVFTFGENNGPDGRHTPGIRLLRGLLELTHELPSGGGKGTLLLGEYNIGSSRVRGSTNDRVRIMKSVDNGLTWTKVVEWNTNGQNQVGHIHAMKQDPYTGYIYILTGDSKGKAGIIKWDGAARWKDNTPLAGYDDLNGFNVLTGLQRHRACDILFDENYFYTFTDTQLPNNNTGSESGIWRGRKDFTSFTRVNNEIFDYDPMHVGWFGEKIGNTFVFTTAREYTDSLNAWKELNTHVYTSADGSNWKKAGQINWRDTGSETTASYITNMFSHENRLYIDCMGAAGHNSTIVCKLSDNPPYSEPVILHPVFFVGNWNNQGNDANPGTNADAPKHTLKGILSANVISAGSRVRISAGDYYETSISPQWSGAFIQGRGSVIVEGKGISQTHLIWSGNYNNYGIYADAGRTMTNSNVPLIFKDIDMKMTPNIKSDHNNNIFRIFGGFVKTISCRIGHSENDESPLIRLESEGSKYISENSIHLTPVHQGGFTDIVEVLSPCTRVSFVNSVIMNSWLAFRLNYHDVMLTLSNCTFFNIGSTGVLLESGFNTQPFIKNCIFMCGVSPIVDRSGKTETQTDYNFYSRETVNVTDGGHSITSDADPRFADPSNFIFDLLDGSPCINKGIQLSDISYDIYYKTRRNPPSIGAFESYASPHTDDIPTLTGETAMPSLTVYPIPADATLFINYRDTDYKTIRLINSSGVVMMKAEVICPHQELNLSTLKPGFYFLEFIKDKTITKVSIIKK